MKKIISVLLALACVVGIASLCGCNDKTDTSDDSAVGSQGVQLGEGDNAINVDEATIKELLSAYPQKALGLKNEIYDYNLKLSKDKLDEKEGVKIEAYLEKAEQPEAVLMFFGSEFYIYDNAKKKYLKLTVNGPQEETTAKKTEEITILTDEQIEADNNKVLKNRYKKYDLSVVKLPKDISEYNLIVTGTAATATDKKQVYVIKVLEKTGEDTGVRFAVGDSGDYYFNAEKNAYVKLK